MKRNKEVLNANKVRHGRNLTHCATQSVVSASIHALRGDSS